jgi:AraC-like DNA-binding protein
MEDFASASMLRILLRANAPRGPGLGRREPAGAHVPIANKQALVAAIVQKGGLSLLLELAQKVQCIEGEPLHRALLGAADPHEFLARWQRMERYVHTSHGVALIARSARRLKLAHRATRTAAAAPLPAESLAVLGVWIGALRAIGTTGLTVRCASAVVHPMPRAAESMLRRLAQAGHLSEWTLAWKECSAQTRTHPADPFTDGILGAAGTRGEPADTLVRWLARDLGKAPKLEAAAAALAMSTRTLQRRLATHCGIGFSDLVGDVRVRLAAAWLTGTEHGLAEIGYLCGFSDQAHFTREFAYRAGITPARYRILAPDAASATSAQRLARAARTNDFSCRS